MAVQTAGIAPTDAAEIGRSVSRLFGRLAADPAFASSFSAAANARNDAALASLVRQTGLQVKSASTSNAPPASSQKTVVTITLTVCNKTTCYTVTITIS